MGDDNIFRKLHTCQKLYFIYFVCALTFALAFGTHFPFIYFHISIWRSTFLNSFQSQQVMGAKMLNDQLSAEWLRMQVVDTKQKSSLKEKK